MAASRVHLQAGVERTSLLGHRRLCCHKMSAVPLMGWEGLTGALVLVTEVTGAQSSPADCGTPLGCRAPRQRSQGQCESGPASTETSSRSTHYDCGVSPPVLT
ncbi:hypothetical protein NP493_50g03023 [Ridgeia piscesae]|uniref:Uncharacterized protein n=1 Tax=Ridgeia piscesae TaxID=27915 RepID=A0AAD9PB66_RIDPI|nr:hypothetical protein NP493_50g03023 [Ridgeia piscesae]